MPSAEDLGISLVYEPGSGGLITRNHPLNDMTRSVLSVNLKATPAGRSKEGGNTTVYSMASGVDGFQRRSGRSSGEIDRRMKGPRGVRAVQTVGAINDYTL